MKHWMRGLGAAVAALTLGTAPALACQLVMAAELKTELMGNRPVIATEINGQKVSMMIDTGAGWSTILPAQAQRLGLKSLYVENVTMQGVGGASAVSRAVIADFKLGTIPIPNMEVFVAGETDSFGTGDVVGVIGASIFSKFDVDFDLSQGVIRVLKPVDCKPEDVVYWDFDYTVAPLKGFNSLNPQFETEVKLNGRKTAAMLDSGASTSVVTLTAAAAAGVTPRSPGVEAVGRSGGMGANTVETWIARFESFAIGDETIKNARLRLADLFQHNKEAETGSRVDKRVEGLPRMLLGADFLRSHRVLISNTQRRIYVAYKGGPVFQVGLPTGQARAEP